MKKKILSMMFILWICTSVTVSAQSFCKNTELPEYIKGRKLTEEEIKIQKECEPELKEWDVELIESQPAGWLAKATLPSKYDSREAGLVTSVKDQATGQNCWAFSIVSAAETSAIKKGIQSWPDFSELHLTYFFYNRVNDPLGNTAYDKNIGELNYLENGGNTQTTALAMSGWTGVAEESIFAENLLSPALAYENSVVLEKAIFLSDDITETKQAIMEYGSIAIMYYHSDEYYNYHTAAYSCPYTSTNHAVNIVGWDDTYSAENFVYDSGVTKAGAWIAKNSWSDAWGDEGYFYISYQDCSVKGKCVYDMVDSSTYDNNYFYDGNAIGGYATLDIGDSVANVFKAKGNPAGDELLKAVQVAVYTTNIQYELKVYKNPQNADIPDSGKLMTTVTGTIEQSGIHTIELPEAVRLRQDEKFSIVFIIKGKQNADIGMEMEADLGSVVFQMGYEEKQSFYRPYYSSRWSDLADYEMCARIKGLTINTEKLLTFEDLFREKELTGLKAWSYGKQKVRLSWEPEPNADGYLIYAKKNGQYGYVGMTTQGTTYTDTRAWDQDYNYYWVFPYVKDEIGKMYPAKCPKYVYAKGICPAVTGLKATSQLGGVKLVWNKSNGAEGYLIYGKVANGPYGYIGMTRLGTSYVDKKASKNEYNFYWVFPYHYDESGKMVVGHTAQYTYGRAL